MADYGALRTGHHVVRRRPPWKSRLIVFVSVAATAIVLYGIFELGRQVGGYSKFAEMQRRRELLAKVETLEQDNEKLRADIAAIELDRSVDRKTNADVKKTLAELQAQVLKQREQLAFYQGIVQPEEGLGGLRVQRFQIVDAGAENRYQLRMLLVQSIRQDAVASGSAIIEIEGVLNNEPVQLSLAEVGATKRADGQVPFKFKYFQNIEQDIALPKNFEPRAVTVEVRSGQRAPVRESYPWQVQAES